jgi:predicted dehydrogenase
MAKKVTPRKSTRPKTRKTFRVGLIGAGGIARTHADHYKQIPGVEVIAAADIVAKNLDIMKDKFGVAELYADWKDMLAQSELDAVSICTPNYLHYQPTLDALNAGLHVMIEKPLAMNATEGQAMRDLARKKGLVCTIAFQHRFEAATQMIKRAVDAGTLGDIMVAKVHAMRRRGIPNWGVFGQKKLQGGGPMIDIGVHAMEMTHYAMGSPKPIGAMGMCWTYMGNKKSNVASMWPNWDYKTYDVEDLCVGHVRFDNGAVMQVEAMFAGHIGPDQEGMKFELMGTKGGASKVPPALFYDKDGTMINAAPAFLPKTNIWTVKMKNFVDACRKGATDKAPVEHGLMIQKMMDAIYASAGQKGKEIAIK